MDSTSLQPLAGDTIHVFDFEQAADLNPRLIREYLACRNAEDIRRTHFFGDRFENTYVPLARIPSLEPLARRAMELARRLLHTDEPMKFGFWFNEMGPGQSTSEHTHEEIDELLSAVYYLRAPSQSGDFGARGKEGPIHVSPVEGRFLFFSPALSHWVESNHSADTRLSVAFNFGPAEIIE